MDKVIITIKNIGLGLIYAFIAIAIVLHLQSEGIEISKGNVRFVGIAIGMYLTAKNLLEMDKTTRQ